MLLLRPGRLYFLSNKGAYTLELLESNKEVVVAVPGMELVNALIGCGTSSGRDVNKVEKFGIPMRKVEGTRIEAPEKLPAFDPCGCLSDS